MARKKSKTKKKSNAGWGMGDMGNMGGMGGSELFNAGMGDPFKQGGKKSKGSDMGFDMGIPTTESGMDLDAIAPTNDFGGLGSFDEVGFDEPPQRQQQQPQGFQGYDASHFHPTASSDVFAHKPQQRMKSNVKQYQHRGKTMVEDPENDGHMITLATYKKRYGKSTSPKRKTRNNVGKRNLGQQSYGMDTNPMGDMKLAFGEMKETYQVGKRVAKTVRERLRNPDAPMMEVETQPDAHEMSYQKEDAVKYSVVVTFDDGSQTSLIYSTLTEAKTKQRSMLSDPSVRNADIEYI